MQPYLTILLLVFIAWYMTGHVVMVAEILDLLFSFLLFSFPHAVRLACVAVQGGNLLIPIHAYPMMNQTTFPRRITFGKCGIGESHAKRVTLACNVPIDFEFGITVTQPNSAFQVQPTQGIVPANGSIEVQVIFAPSRLVTELMEIEVNDAYSHSSSY